MPDIHLGLVVIGRAGLMPASNIATIDGVRLSVADMAAERARQVAAELDAGWFPTVSELIAGGIDGLVIAAGTGAHPELIMAGIDATAPIPVFYEKPVAPDMPTSMPLLKAIAATNASVQIGHQRRVGAGYVEAKRAYGAGELGWLHSLRAITCDMAPPPTRWRAPP